MVDLPVWVVDLPACTVDLPVWVVDLPVWVVDVLCWYVYAIKERTSRVCFCLNYYYYFFNFLPRCDPCSGLGCLRACLALVTGTRTVGLLAIIKSTAAVEVEGEEEATSTAMNKTLQYEYYQQKQIVPRRRSKKERRRDRAEQKRQQQVEREQIRLVCNIFCEVEVCLEKGRSLTDTRTAVS